LSKSAGADHSGPRTFLLGKGETKMTGIQTLFPRSSFVGFDHLFNELEHTARHAADHYPPHNIIKASEHEYLIELAVAGFSKDELSVEVKDRTLSISGQHVSRGRDFIHRGISTKKFKRTFRLSEHVHVHGADIRDGILAIELKYVVPESLRPRKISIGKNEEKSNDTSNINSSQLLNESN
jgi:molecular chaperone IbpA|tara:strand:- start:2207 stop:2749 length:543 start_codon:yes stop_codon:yes gene_type:complete